MDPLVGQVLKRVAVELVGRSRDGVDANRQQRSVREAEREGLQDTEGPADPLADPARPRRDCGFSNLT
jgi:hypothetical protein